MQVPFEVTFFRGSTYRIRNTTDATVELVTVTVDHPVGLTRELPTEETFGPGATREFMVIGTGQAPAPTEVLVSWDVHPTPYALPLPPKD